MDKNLYKCLHQVSDNRATVCNDNFIVKINDYQLFGEKSNDTYDISIMSNYIIREKGRVNKEDILYFLIYFKNKSEKIKNKNFKINFE